MRKSLAVVAIASMLSGAALADPLTLPQYMAALKPVGADATVRYGPAPQQTIGLFLPRSTGPHPVVVLVHGGCFSNDVPAASVSQAAADLAAHGVAVWNIEYRRVGDPGGGYPGMYQDVGAAIDKLRDEAGPRGLDLSRIVLVGHSSGAVLSLWAAGRANLPVASPLRVDHALKPQAVVSIAGLGDLKGFAPLLPWICGDDLKIEQVVGVKSPERPDPFADTSPRALLPNGVPTLAMAGDYDAELPPYMSLYWKLAAQKKGDRVETQVIRDAGHFDVVSVQTPAWATVRDAILKVVASLRPGV